MDREVQEQKMQFLGFFGILKESFKIIISCRKIFSQISLILILPLTIIFFADLNISNGHMKFEKSFTTHATNILSHRSLSSEWMMTFWLFKTAYSIFMLILYLLSMAAVVYTTTTSLLLTTRPRDHDDQLTFKKVIMSFVPKVWKTLLLTLLWVSVTFVVYNLFAILLLIICIVTFPNKDFGFFPVVVFIIIYVMGLLYMTVIWQLASVVTVVESASSYNYGLKAMTKASDLIQGKRAVALWITLLLTLLIARVKTLFELYVLYGSSSFAETWKRVGFGVMCCFLFLSVLLLGLVNQTVLYLVCKSYHQENIDKDDLLMLLNHHAEYNPVNENDIQLQQHLV